MLRAHALPQCRDGDIVPLQLDAVELRDEAGHGDVAERREGSIGRRAGLEPTSSASAGLGSPIRPTVALSVM